MRDRLEQLMRQADISAMDRCITDYNEAIKANVDYLLANGVIVPPCKVGDTVYYLTSVDTEKELNIADIFIGTVQSVTYDGKSIWVSVKYTNRLYDCHTLKDFGKTVFLTKEEAENALKERSER